MTFKEYATDFLSKNGMWPEMAEEVVTRAMADPANGPMAGRWDDDVSGYGDVALNVLRLSIRYAALDYIKENCPEAWFRPNFETGGGQAGTGLEAVTPVPEEVEIQ